MFERVPLSIPDNPKHLITNALGTILTGSFQDVSVRIGGYIPRGLIHLAQQYCSAREAEGEKAAHDIVVTLWDLIAAANVPGRPATGAMREHLSVIDSRRHISIVLHLAGNIITSHVIVRSGAPAKMETPEVIVQKTARNETKYLVIISFACPGSISDKGAFHSFAQDIHVTELLCRENPDVRNPEPWRLRVPLTISPQPRSLVEKIVEERNRQQTAPLVQFRKLDDQALSHLVTPPISQDLPTPPSPLVASRAALFRQMDMRNVMAIAPPPPPEPERERPVLFRQFDFQSELIQLVGEDSPVIDQVAPLLGQQNVGVTMEDFP
jgi:hypothetical protein